MQDGVSTTAVKRIAPLLPGNLCRAWLAWGVSLMAIAVKDLVNWQVQEGELDLLGCWEVFSLCVGRDVPSHASMSYRLERSRVTVRGGYFRAHLI